ncbi:MAG: RNA-binding S4 domain-containing protein [Clostridia bacterium]|nr:RNA-binding S4 domain-containing protein [Clostridia bacterium]
MRIDKFLKVSRLIKRRTVANEACGAGRVSIGGKAVKAGADVKIGDVVEIGFGEKKIRLRVLSLSEHVTKEAASSMYEIIGEN